MTTQPGNTPATPNNTNYHRENIMNIAKSMLHGLAMYGSSIATAHASMANRHLMDTVIDLAHEDQR